MPLGKIPAETVRAILAGGASVCAEAGIPVAGGHSIDSARADLRPGRVGLVHPDRVLRNAARGPGDALILTKGLGVGIYQRGAEAGRARRRAGYAGDARHRRPSSTRSAPSWRESPACMRVTDVTGFGLLGHALEMCRGAGLAARSPGRRAASGRRRGARARPASDGRGRAELGELRRRGRAAGRLADWQRDLLCDPQTSGGLLIAVAPSATGRLLAQVRTAGFSGAAVIGELSAGVPESS